MLKNITKAMMLAVFMLGMGSAHAAPDVSGYFNFEYIGGKNDSGKELDPYFRQHYLNLLVQHSVDSYKFMAEIEFEDAVKIDYGRTPKTGDASGENQGKLFIERAWGEVAFSPMANLRIGWLLNSSWYAQNHYPSILYNFVHPEMYKKIFNFNQMGVRLWGQKEGIYYDVWTARGPNSAAGYQSGTDMGGKLGYTFKVDGGDVTVAYQMADYSNAASDKKDQASGIEVVANVGKFGLVAESATRKEETSTNDMTGAYALLSYTMGLGGSREITPYFMWDSFKEKESNTEAKVSHALGFAYRPVPTITFKAEHYATPAWKDTPAATKKDASQNTLTFIYFYN